MQFFLAKSEMIFYVRVTIMSKLIDIKKYKFLNNFLTKNWYSVDSLNILSEDEKMYF